MINDKIVTAYCEGKQMIPSWDSCLSDERCGQKKLFCFFKSANCEADFHT